MNELETTRLLREYAAEYNDWKYFTGDPIIFPKHQSDGRDGMATLRVRQGRGIQR